MVKNALRSNCLFLDSILEFKLNLTKSKKLLTKMCVVAYGYHPVPIHITLLNLNGGD